MSINYLAYDSNPDTLCCQSKDISHIPSFIGLLGKVARSMLIEDISPVSWPRC